MADPYAPDFSQTQQFAPGFQQAMPILGITSSYQQFQQPQQFAPMPMPYQPQFQMADLLSSQNSNNMKMTMQIMQQNLMNSMHTAMMGTMGAFTDMSRRGGAMLQRVGPPGAYNDFLAPNQNWALESSFRREVGYGVSNYLGLDPRNSFASRLIQGRRPEFLTEGEYGTTMGFATQLREKSIEKGLLSVAGSTGLGMLMSATGAGLASSIAIPVLGGIAIDRALEAAHAKEEDLLTMQMYTRNKRVGIGQQFISTKTTKNIHDAFYDMDNPYWSRFFGDNKLGNAFKPDVVKSDIFKKATENGMLAFESLDSDSIINYVNKIASSVEKFSRIGKVTREVAQKLMGDIKGAGVHGSQMFEAFESAAYTSNLTGIDMQQLVGIKVGAARQAQAYGFNNFHAMQSSENIISGFAMMQNAGAFKNKDLMQLTQGVLNYNMSNARNGYGIVMRNGGTVGGAMNRLREIGGGDALKGYLSYMTADHEVGGIDAIKKEIENHKKQGRSYRDIKAIITSQSGGDLNIGKLVDSIWFGEDEVGKNQQLLSGYARLQGREFIPDAVDVRDLGQYTTQDSGVTSMPWLDRLMSPKHMIGYNEKKILSKKEGGDSYSKNLRSIYEEMRGKVKNVLDRYGSVDANNIENISYDLLETTFKLNKKGEFSNSRYSSIIGEGETARHLLFAMIKETDPGKWKAMSELQGGRYTNDTSISGRLTNLKHQILKYAGRADANGITETASDFINYLSREGKGNTFAETITKRWKEAGGKFASIKDFAKDIRMLYFHDMKLDQSKIDEWVHNFENGEEGEQNVISLLTGLEKKTHDYRSKRTAHERKLMMSLGFMTKGGQYDSKRFEKAISPIRDFRNKYYNGDELTSDAKDGAFSSSQYVKDFYALATSKDKDTQNLFRKYMGKLNVDALVKEYPGKGQMELDRLNVIGNSLKGVNLIESITESGLKELQNKSSKEVSEDPSDKAVANMNQLLGEILTLMKKQNTPKQNSDKSGDKK